MDVFNLQAKISLDTRDYTAALGKAGDISEKFGNAVKGAFATSMKVGAAAIGAVVTETTALSAALVKGVGDLAEYGDHIDKQSQKMNMSAQAYQEWDAILQHSGTSIDSMQASIKTLSSAVETGNDAFGLLGMSLEDVQRMNGEELFSATITALQNVEDDTQRTYIAGQLLGRGATELGALLNTSAEDTEKMRQRVHELGGVMGNDAVKAAAKYQDSLQDMKTSMSGLTRGITSEFLPSFTEVMDGLTDIFAGQDGGAEKVSNGIDNILGNVGSAVSKLKPVVSRIGGVIGSALKENAPKLIKQGTELFGDIIVGAVQALPDILSTTGDIISNIGSVITEKIPTVFSIGQQILSAVADDLLNVDYEKLSTNLSSIVRSALGSIKDFVSGIDSHKLGEDVSDLLNGLQWKDILTDVADTIGAVIKGIPDFLSGIIENIDLDNASLVFATLFTPKLATSLASSISTSPEFKRLNGTLGETMAEGASSSFFSKFTIALETFALSWSAGTFIRNLIGPEKIDSAVESVFEDLRLKFTGKNNETIAKEIEEMDKYKSPGIAAQMVRDAYEATGHDARGRYATGGIINHTVYDRYGNMFGEAGREAILPLDTNTEWMDKLAGRINGGGARNIYITINANHVDSEADFDKLADKIDRKLSERYVSESRAIGATGW